MIVVKVDLDGYEKFDVYVFIVVGFESFIGIEFDFVVGFIIEVGIMGKDNRII